MENQAIIAELFALIQDRRANPPAGSYTARLFAGGLDRICKKVGEEATEVVIAAKNRSHEELVYESADLIYHLLVLWADAGVNLEDVYGELARRRGSGGEVAK